MTRSPLITLLTDFGLQDTYVAAMKGVVLSHCRDAQVVDLTHAIAPGDVVGGADALATVWRYFPDGTIHCAVVDPGVGTDRRVLAVHADDQYLVGPDNGLFDGVISAAQNVRIVHVTRKEFFLSPMSRTFHGRDVFAPVAAALGRGIALEDLGNEVDQVLQLPQMEVEETGGQLIGQVVHVDRFGNLITNLPGHRMPIDPVIHIGNQTVRGLVGSYEQGPAQQPLAIIGSRQTLEISINGFSAAEKLGVDRGQPVRVEGGGL